jgi:hypothetical protein
MNKQKKNKMINLVAIPRKKKENSEKSEKNSIKTDDA